MTLTKGQRITFRDEKYTVDAVVDEDMGCVRLRKVGAIGGYVYLDKSELDGKKTFKVMPWQRGR